MKKSLLVILLAVFLSGCGQNKVTQNPLPSLSVKNATYIIEGKPVTLKDGVAKEASDSASEVITRYFGNEAVGDLNGDGQDDIAFLLTQETGGSGTFFYVVVALRANEGFRGTNAILLGDRIAPQTTQIEGGVIIVNYADRKPGEPMTVGPSVGISKRFRVADGELVEGGQVYKNVLDLSNQDLMKIPEYVFRQTNLEELDLSNNEIIGAIQAEIRQLRNLRVLNLSNNSMTGLPAEIGQLQNLEVLDVSNNQLTGLPYELGNLQNLKVLNLSGNSYSTLDLGIIRKRLSGGTTIID